jgi:hypothetical protein
MAGLPSYNYYGLFGSDPSGSSVSNPLVGNPSGGTAANNPLVANPGGGSAVPATANTDPNFQYNLTSGNQSGSGVFGGVPGTVQVPDPYTNLESVFPELAGANSGLSSSIMNELQGGLTSQTMSALDQAESDFGITGPINTSPASLGTTSQQQQSEGISQWDSLLPTIATSQTVSPEVQAQIAQFNAQNQAAPNPGAQGEVQAGASVLGLLALLA